MRTTLIVGVETIAGAHIAAVLAEQSEVIGLTEAPTLSLPHCRTIQASLDGADASSWIADLQPATVILCGPAACSAWDPRTNGRINEHMTQQASAWAAAASEHGCSFVYISSDAVFTGPWMFHEEESLSVCASREAALLRDGERQVVQQCPEALIVRTNTYGWAPESTAPGWIEQILADLDRRSLQQYDFIRHGTPILASDLADILSRAIDEGLQGLYHVAGAERVNPLQFAQRLADHFELPWLAVRRSEEALVDPAVGFGAGETSLQTKRIRKALCVAMPMLSEGLRRLHEQQLAIAGTQFGPDYPVALRQSA